MHIEFIDVDVGVNNVNIDVIDIGVDVKDTNIDMFACVGSLERFELVFLYTHKRFERRFLSGNHLARDVGHIQAARCVRLRIDLCMCVRVRALFGAHVCELLSINGWVGTYMSSVGV